MGTMTPFSDHAALKRHRARALRLDGDRFLHRMAFDDIRDRLAVINKSFTAPAAVADFADPWADLAEGTVLVPDAEVLDIEPGAHDLVVSAFNLHWAADPVGHLIQLRRALRPDGLMIAVAFGGRTLAELRSAMAEAEVAVSGGLSPRVAPMADIRDLGALLQRAGFALPVADSDPLTVEYRSIRHLVRDLRAMGETNALTGRLRHATRRRIFDEAERIYRSAHPSGTGLHATFEVVTLTGWAPHASQPKPLRPGSATARLADALGVPEGRIPGPDD